MNINPNYMNNASISLPINTDTQLPQASGISSQASTSVHPFDTMTQEERVQTMQRLELEVQQMQYQVQLRQMYSELQFQQQQMNSLADATRMMSPSRKKKKEEEEEKEKLELPKTSFKQIVEIERRHSADLLNNSKKRKAREEDESSTNEPSTKNIKVSRAA